MPRHISHRTPVAAYFSFVLIPALLGATCNAPAADAEEPAAEERPPHDVAFTANVDQSIQRYVMIIPDARAADQSMDVLIALHGHGSDRWQFVRDSRDECKASRDVAAARHMLFVSPDYRAKTSWMGPAAEADLVQIIAELKTQFRVRHVFLCGGSMGGASCLTFAALHPELIAGVASMNGTANHLEYTNFQDAISQSFGGSKSQIPEEYKRRSAEYWPERFTMPVAFSTGGLDESVPPDSVLRLHRTLQLIDRQSHLVHREQGGHATNYDDATEILNFVIDHAAVQ